MAIKKGDIIMVHYVGTFDDGSVFDSSETLGRPFKFEVGAGHIIKGFDDSVLGKEVGDEYSIRLKPSEAYGEYQKDLLGKVPISKFPKDAELEPGMMLQIIDQHGNGHFATITEVTELDVSYDMNHPMAGKTLNFQINILETGCEPDFFSSGFENESHDHSDCGDGCCDDCGHNH
ncbi:MAG: peptidylprolyl isomerase [Candidatus Lokiarchaeota archaeon]|nr:peptidylprolyl isomerase [Candidatus Lokiarchaeota archaeon]